MEGTSPRTRAQGSCWISVSKRHSAARAIQSGIGRISKLQDDSGIPHDTHTYVSLLRRYRESRDLPAVKRLHAQIVSTGHDRVTFICNLLVQMYGKCGDVDDARLVFDKIHLKNVFSWTIMIAAYAQNGHCTEAIGLFKQMSCKVIPEEATFVSVLAACSKSRSLAEGQAIHKQIVACGLDSSIVLGNTLINMYGKCGSLRDARSVFDKMPRRTVVSWNAIIGAYSQNAQCEEAMELYGQMRGIGVIPDDFTYLAVLHSCSCMKDLAEGKAIHELVILQGLESHTMIGNALINMYGKCGSLEDARRVFERMASRNVVSFNTLISGYAQNGHGFEAIEIYERMLSEVKPEDVTYVVLLDACTSVGSLEDGLLIHADIDANGFDTRVTVQNALVNMYGKCGSLKDARYVFERIECKDVVSWTAMITALTQNGEDKIAMSCFKRMQLEGIEPNDITFAGVLNACCNLGDLTEGKVIHAIITASGIQLDVVLGTVLVNLYGKCGGRLDDARRVFDQMREKNVFSWNAMLAAYAQHGHLDDTLALYHEMIRGRLKPNEATFGSILAVCSRFEDVEMIHEQVSPSGFGSNVIVGTALVNAYGKMGEFDKTRSVFDRIHAKDVVAWTSMIAVYNQYGLGKEALKLYQQMNLEGLKPKETTFSSILGACSNLEEGRAIYETILSSGCDSDPGVGNALINMFGKCGDLHEARHVFDKMIVRSVVSWTTMLASYAQHGLFHEVLIFFKEMQLEGVEPNEVTVTIVLYACSHAGLLTEGWHCFTSISGDFGMAPSAENYGSMVDLLGRAGKLEEAEELINMMPFQPDAVAWTTLLGACKTHKSVGLGVHAADQVLDLEPGTSASYVMLSNIYAAT